ncbi:LysR substrate-binding domain-containing protein [Pseudomonas sp. PH1b]|uniref:LysR substrate-binding domain-containing protein n=1 Tax=Pseudomonas sp. PH1b TaxID=1397282 RepID=UPI0009DDABA3|nr:LysR substrate-binding domain-containing protein [Pseudomonas sp. PH1b]
MLRERIFGGLLVNYKGLEVEVVVSDVESELIEEGIDLMFFWGRPRTGSYVVRKVCSSMLGLFASASYLERNGVPKVIDDLKEYCCFWGGGQAELKLRDGSGVKAISLRNRLKSKSVPALINIADHGMGILLANTLYMANSSSLMRVLPDFHAEGEGLYVVYSNPHALSASARVVLDYALMISMRLLESG